MPLGVDATEVYQSFWDWEVAARQQRELYLVLLEQQPDGTYKSLFDGVHTAGAESLSQLEHVLVATDTTVSINGSNTLGRIVVGSNDESRWMGPLMERGRIVRRRPNLASLPCTSRL